MKTFAHSLLYVTMAVGILLGALFEVQTGIDSIVWFIGPSDIGLGVGIVAGFKLRDHMLQRIKDGVSEPA